MFSADHSPPCDRPNLSKDYLMGTAPAEWIPLRPPEFYTEQRIDLVLNSEVTTWTLLNAKCNSRAASALPTTRCCWPPAPRRCG